MFFDAVSFAGNSVRYSIIPCCEDNIVLISIVSLPVLQAALRRASAVLKSQKPLPVKKARAKKSD
jgi:hypothetical protein